MVCILQNQVESILVPLDVKQLDCVFMIELSEDIELAIDRVKPFLESLHCGLLRFVLLRFNLHLNYFAGKVLIVGFRKVNLTELSLA